MMRIALGCDHAGFALKGLVIEELIASGHDIIDVGTYTADPVDYPSFCAAAAREVTRGSAEAAIVIGGSGQGEAITANKVKGARAALCHDETTARLARQHNDANVLALGERILAGDLARAIVKVFLTTPFDGGRHVARLAQIADIEAEEATGSTA